MEKISAVIITYNEEKNIKKCIDSLKNIADEIIVLDSFSVDKTKEICLTENVKFYQHKFDGHIQQKNRVIKYASNKFVLSLDADEVISKKLRKSILKVKENPKYDSYYFNRLNFYCGKAIHTTNWYPDRKLRLWHKGKGRWGGINPHDKVIMSKNTSSKFISGDLHHFSFNSIEEHIIQANKFSSIAAEQIIKNKKKNLVFKMIFNPFYSFIKSYFIKKGITQGYYGFIISIVIAFENYLKYSKAILIKKRKS